MKILYAYYSRTGNNVILAKKISKSLGASLERIETSADLSGMFAMVRAGLEALLNILPRINEPKEDPSGYDLVIIGTPVWANNIPSPMKAYLQRMKNKIKRYAIASLSGSGNSPNMVSQVKKLTGANPVAVLEISMPKTEKPSMDAVIGDDYLEKERKEEIREFVKKIKSLD